MLVFSKSFTASFSSVCVCSVIVQFFAALWTVACQVPLSMKFSRQYYWSGLPFPTPGDLPDLETEPESLTFLALAGRFFTTQPPGKPSTSECDCIWR